jgi:hypothetical protein
VIPPETPPPVAPPAADPPPAPDRNPDKAARVVRVRKRGNRLAPPADPIEAARPLPGLPSSVMVVERRAAQSAPPPPPAARAIPPPAPTTVDLDKATVSVSAVSTTSGIPGSNIRAAVSRLPLARCYREALRTRGSPAPGTAILQLRIDGSGYVASAQLQDAQFLPAMRGCIEQAARALRVRDVDTGEASAVVTLRFESVP